MNLGKKPKKVTFVGFPFKKQRIMMHYSVLASIFDDFNYDGAAMTAEALHELSEKFPYPFEVPNTIDLNSPKIDAATRQSFQASKYGCAPDLLEKRLQRNPFHLVHSYYHSCPDLEPFFGDCYNKHF